MNKEFAATVTAHLCELMPFMVREEDMSKYRADNDILTYTISSPIGIRVILVKDERNHYHGNIIVTEQSRYSTVTFVGDPADPDVFEKVTNHVCNMIHTLRRKHLNNNYLRPGDKSHKSEMTELGEAIIDEIDRALDVWSIRTTGLAMYSARRANGIRIGHHLTPTIEIEFRNTKLTVERMTPVNKNGNSYVTHSMEFDIMDPNFSTSQICEEIKVFIAIQPQPRLTADDVLALRLNRLA